MRKITLKATRYEEVNGKVEACIGDCVFADTKEIAGTRRGWSGAWEVTNLKGETKHFTTEKAIREWLGSQETEKEMTEAEQIAELKKMKEQRISFIIKK